MEKEKKEIITKKECAQMLIKRLYFRLYASIACSWLGVLCIWLGYTMQTEWWWNFWDKEAREALDVLFFLVGSLPGITMMLCGIVILWMVADTLLRFVRYKRLDFLVIEDTLMRTARETVRTPKGYREEKVLYFLKSGRYVISGKDKSVFEYSSEDDKFYIMTYGKKQVPVAVYNQKVYEYRTEME